MGHGDGLVSPKYIYIHMYTEKNYTSLPTKNAVWWIQREKFASPRSQTFESSSSLLSPPFFLLFKVSLYKKIQGVKKMTKIQKLVVTDQQIILTESTIGRKKNSFKLSQYNASLIVGKSYINKVEHKTIYLKIHYSCYSIYELILK